MKPVFPSGPATRSALYALGLLSALKALSLVLMAQAVAGMLAGFAAGTGDWDSGLIWGAVGAVLRSLTVWGQGIASRHAALGVKEELRAQLLRRSLADGGPSPVAGMNDGGLAILATRGLDALDDYYTQYLPALVNCATVPLLIGARILFADWVSAVVIVLTVPLVPLFMVLIGRHTEDSVRDAQTTLRRLSGHILELAKGLPVLVGLGRASEQRAALEDISEQYRSKTMGTLRTAFLSALALELIATISVAVVAVFIGVRLVAGDMALEAGLLALILAPDCYLPLRELGTAHHASDDGRAALETTNAVLEVPAHQPLQAGGPSSTASTDVVVSGLSVTYRGRSGAAVGPLSFTAPRGSITALDGDSGTGKSTVLGVLAGLIGPGPDAAVTGTVTGSGAVAWVPQHPVIAAETVQEEMELYLDGYQGDVTEAVTRVLQKAKAEHLAARNPAELSPGELRRVALARGLARVEAGATVLLLDEPTAHLDHYSAGAVRNAIETLRGTVTVILVAHDADTRALAEHLVPIGSKRHEAGPEVPLVRARNTTDSAAARDAAAVVHPVMNPAAKTSSLKGLLVILKPVQWKFAAAGTVAVLAALFAVALSGLSGWLIIRASEQPPILYLLGAIVGVRFFGIGRAVLRYCERLLTHDAVFAAMTHLRGALWATLSRRALSLRRLLHGGNVLGSVVDDVDTLRDLLPRVVLPPVTAVGVGGAAIAATAIILPAALPAVVVASVVGLALAPLLAVLADRNAARAEQQMRSAVLRGVAAALDARAELTANSVAGPLLKDLRTKDRAATLSAQRSAWAEGLGQSVIVLACSLGALWAGALSAPSVANGSVATELVAVVVLMQLALVDAFGGIVSAVRQAPALAAVLGRVAESGALDAPAAVDRAETPDGGPQPLPDRDGKVGLELNDAAAAWPGGPNAFAGLTAEAGPGRWLAVTGPSGAGKTTLLSVLLGFLPLAQGSAKLTGAAAWCPQEAYLFDSTIRGNLLLSRPAGAKPSEDDMRKALADVGLDGVVAALPGGLDARIGPGGSFLSGGERQRLAMARTLLTGASVLLLDEPTAHLDAGSAREMMAILRKGLKDVTVVLVTHNPEDIDPADARLELPAARPAAYPAVGAPELVGRPTPQ
ncbi:thiol reductant ABC exporter subunit CydD [Arthrobacter sp. AK01]|uniref:thiol reductant ABC exporter subunit CydD n=1 Tax=Micrococcaceae TaxID=1268 RepID=UPI001E4B5392|nr:MULTISPECIES: thiol reductant ABC exporter subunit CydD [Micrococcaceae]MCD4850070.1 thiol reductant ABC exporter subunit CydD [Arthrobacter sp. AK01]MCP1413494.1 ATP-binding cassette subfamily C protein CydCD [Paenarthrobacter sp. A20]